MLSWGNAMLPSSSSLDPLQSSALNYQGTFPPAGTSRANANIFGKDPTDRGLRSIVGGSLHQLSLSLERLPASRTHALPSHEARALLRSVGFFDPAPPDVSSLHKQPGHGFGGIPLAGTEGGVEGSEEREAVEYAELSGAVLERVARLARLHTDNFLRSEVERDWEEERAGLIGGADYSSKATKGDGDISGQGGTASRRGGAVCSPVAGFADREFVRWHRDGGAGLEHLEHRWREGGRFLRLAQVVIDLNRRRWGREGSTDDHAKPFLLLADVQDGCYDYHEPRSGLVRGAPAGRDGSRDGSLSGSCFYFAELNKMLHAIVSRDRPPQELTQTRGRRRVAWLLRGVLQHLQREFRGVLAQAHSDRMEGGEPLVVGPHEDVIYVRNHLLRFAPTASFPREWQVDTFSVDESSHGRGSSTLQVPLWAEVLFLMRCGSARVEHLFTKGQGSAAGDRVSSLEQAFENMVSPVFAEALRQWAHSTDDDAKPLHALEFNHTMTKDSFIRACIMNPEGDPSHARFYHLMHQYRQATGQDTWHKAVVSLLNSTDDHPGDLPTGGGRGGQQSRAEASYWTKRDINELPPLLGDPAEQLCLRLGRDPGCDKLLCRTLPCPVRGLPLSTPCSPSAHDRSLSSWVKDVGVALRLPEFIDPHPQLRRLNTAVLLQKSLWRMVQDYLWRQVAFVQPESTHPVLSLEHCQTTGIQAVIECVGQFFPSFKATIRSITTGSPLPEAVSQPAKTVVSYNIVQMLFLTLQLQKGLRELAKLGGVHQVEAAHTCIALHHSGALQGPGIAEEEAMEDDVGGGGGNALTSGLISELLQAYLLPVYVGIGDGRSLFGHMLPQKQVERALHYCLVMQDIPTDSALNSPSTPRGRALQNPDLSHESVELLAQLSLSVPASTLHFAFRSVLGELLPPDAAHHLGSDTAHFRRELLKQLMHQGRVRAAEVCCLKGELLLRDAALLLYWAERDTQIETPDAPMHLDRYLQTVTALLDLYASPGRCSDRTARSKVLRFCGELVEEMSHVVDGDIDERIETVPGSIANQALDVYRWLQRSHTTSPRSRTRLAVLLHTWQTAKAQELFAAGMPLDALRELLDLPCPGRREMQFAPVVRNLMEKAFQAGGAGAPPLGDLSGQATGARRVTGNVCFLPSLQHGINAEQAVAQVETIVAATQLGSSLSSKHLVPDCIIVALQCFLSLQQQRHVSNASASGSFTSKSASFLPSMDYSADDIAKMLSPPKRSRPAEPQGSADRDNHIRSRSRASWSTPRARTEGASVLGSPAGGQSAMHGMSLHQDQHELVKSISWHVEELQRCVHLLVARNLCPHDLKVHVGALLDASNVAADE